MKNFFYALASLCDDVGYWFKDRKAAKARKLAGDERSEQDRARETLQKYARALERFKALRELVGELADSDEKTKLLNLIIRYISLLEERSAHITDTLNELHIVDMIARYRQQAQAVIDSLEAA